MIKRFAIEIISVNRRGRTPGVIQDKHRYWRDVDRWTWWSVNRSKPSSVDSLSSSDWFSRELLGRWSLDSLSKCSGSDWPSESWTWEVKDDLLNTVFLLRTCSNASVFRSYTPWRGNPWLLTRGSYSHRRNTKNDSTGLEGEFLVCGTKCVNQCFFSLFHGWEIAVILRNFRKTKLSKFLSFFLFYFFFYSLSACIHCATRRLLLCDIRKYRFPAFYGTSARQAAIFFCTRMMRTWSSFSLVRQLELVKSTPAQYFFVFQ